jgi:hypothetical protein
MIMFDENSGYQQYNGDADKPDLFLQRVLMMMFMGLMMFVLMMMLMPV